MLEVSLAYFIGPLLNVLLGIFVLSERLDRTQWIAVGFAAAGVAYLTFIAGHTPWIALMVGSSFAHLRADSQDGEHRSAARTGD